MQHRGGAVHPGARNGAPVASSSWQAFPQGLSQSGMGLEDESIGASVHQDASRESTDESVIAGGLRITINPPRSSFF